jgi:hypothetical protein
MKWKGECNMKGLIRWIICLMSLSVMFGCSGMENNTIIIEGSGINNIQKEDITLIKSFSDFENYFREERFASASNEFKDQVNSYSEEYFESNYLIILHSYETSSSFKLKIKSIKQTDDNVHITIKRKSPNIVDTAMQEWSFFIEIKKDETINNVTYQIIE